MARLHLLKPLPWTVEHASHIWESKDLLTGLGNYPSEIRKEVVLIESFLGRKFCTVRKYGWILYGIGDRAKNLQKIFLSGTYDKSHFDRSVHVKLHPKREGQKVVCLEIMFESSFAKELKRESDYLVFDTKGKLMRTSFAALRCPNWDPDCPEALQNVKDGDIFLEGMEDNY
jgi:hypothetical protein